MRCLLYHYQGQEIYNNTFFFVSLDILWGKKLAIKFSFNCLLRVWSLFWLLNYCDNMSIGLRRESQTTSVSKCTKREIALK